MFTRQTISNLLYYLSALLITMSVLWFLVYVPHVSYLIPQNYSSDGLLTSGIIKSIMESKSYVANPFLAAPLTFSIVDFPVYTPLNFIFAYLLSFFFQDYSALLNTYYYLTYPLATLIALPILRKFGLNKPFAFSASILFAFTPYHYMREINHLLINLTFIPPIYVLLAWSVYEINHDVGRNNTAKLFTLNFKNIGLMSLAIIGGISSVGGYFAFFGCFLLIVAGGVASINNRSFANLAKALVLISFSAMAFLISMFPTITHDLQTGKSFDNASFSRRLPGEAEVYSLKITQLLFPVDMHRVKALRLFKNKYNASAQLVNENTTATLGIIAGIGFLILLAALIIKKLQENNTLYFLSIMNISCLLLGITGGFGAIFSYSISPMLRGYNRISVYISFLSLLGFFVALQMIMKKFSWDKNKLLIYLMATVILCVGLLDQVSIRNKKLLLKQIESSYISDDQFIKSIERTMPANSAILQLPFLSFPVSSNAIAMEPFEHFKPYLHSHTLRWSYGASAETILGDWNKNLASLPTATMIHQVIAYGFTGIYISREGYKDKGRNLESELYSVTKTKPLVNKEGTSAFYNLRPYIRDLEKKNLFNKSEITSNVKKLYMDYVFSKGFYALEESQGKSWRWSYKNGRIMLNNYSRENIPVKINFKLQTAFPQKADIFITGDLVNTQLKVGDKEVPFSRSFILKPGKHSMNFRTNANRVLIRSEVRDLYFRLNDFSLSS